MMKDFSYLSISKLLAWRAETLPDAPAILAPDRVPLSYGELFEQVSSTVQRLNQLGIGCDDRVAIVLPNGPEMAVAFLSIAAGAVSAPLNPAYGVAEFDFYLSDLQARAVVTLKGMDSHIRQAASQRGIPILELTPQRQAGMFQIEGEAQSREVRMGFASETDIALILHTSGTTSRPKMVPLTQTNICASARHICQTLELGHKDRCLNIMPLFHIHGLMAAVFATIVAGGSLVCSPGLQTEAFFDWMDEFEPTWYTAVPTMHQAILSATSQRQDTIQRNRLRFVRSSSASLPPAVMAELECVFRAPVIESYGMTEAAHQMASNPLPPAARKPGSVGLPAGPQVEIMDQAGNFLPPETPGEIVIRGENVMAGYLNNPEANQNAFTNAWFRTGDQGRLDDEGYLFITGRLKEIINRGGEKITPREVDETLLQHPAVAQAVTFAMPHTSLGEDVACAVVLRPGASVNEKELRQYSAQRLVDFKVPRRIVFVEKIPTGPTGKLQRIGLYDLLQRQLLPNYAAPSNFVEEMLVTLWQDILAERAGGKIGIHDNFFSLGGDSLLGARLIAQVQAVFEIEVPLSALFREPTITEFAILVESLLVNKEETLSDQVDWPMQAALPGEDRRTLASFSQQRLWFLYKLDPQSVAYNVSNAYYLKGKLDLSALDWGMRQIIRRNEILRTSITEEGGEVWQVIHSPDIELPEQFCFQVVDFAPRFESQIDRQLVIQDTLLQAARQPYDLERGPLLRLLLLKLDVLEYILFVGMHHIISDGWSWGVLYKELAAHYEAYLHGKAEGNKPVLPDLPFQFAEYADRQRQWLQGDQFQRSLDFWRKYLEGAPSTCDLPGDFSRPERMSYHGSKVHFNLPQSLSQALITLCKREKVTPFMFFMAAFNVLLYRYSSQEDILVGFSIANRQDIETESLIGPLANSLPLRTDLSGQPSLSQLLVRLRQAFMDVLAHQDVPFEKLVQEINPERQPNRMPLFQMMFAWHSRPAASWSLPGVANEFFPVDDLTSPFDLTLNMGFSRKAPELIEGNIEYSSELYSVSTIERMVKHFRTLLEGIIADPDQPVNLLPLLSPLEREDLLIARNRTQVDYPTGHPVVQLFEDQAARTPQAIAIVGKPLLPESAAWLGKPCSPAHLCYAELNQAANRLAMILQSHCVGPDVLVGICLERSPEQVAAILATLKAGGAYVPLDPQSPTERLRFILQDAQISVLITIRPLAQRLDGADGWLKNQSVKVLRLDEIAAQLPDQAVENLPPVAGEDHLAYVIYTSGSTGEPKGVGIPQRALLNHTYWMQDLLQLQASDKVLFKTPFTFDASVWEYISCLSFGATLVLAAPQGHRDPSYMTQLIQKEQITVIQLVPAQLRLLLAEKRFAECDSLRFVLCGGEALTPELAQRLFDVLTKPTLVNLYGPSEACIDSTFWVCRPGNPVERTPIGRPISNVQAYVLDPCLQPVPQGAPGELYLGGAGLGRAYLNRPHLTGEKFIPNPFVTSGKNAPLIYRTGDLVRYLPDGNLDFLGRIDEQVKLRGYRIELGEIEAVLEKFPAVKQAAVLVSQSELLGEVLTGYVVFDSPDDSATKAQELRRHLQTWLPEHMHPGGFLFLETFPTTSSGKIDRQALTALPLTNLETGFSSQFSEPQGEIERQLAEIWAEVLGRQQVSRTDHFFEIGGHSLLAMRMLARIADTHQIVLPLRTIFDSPRLVDFAQILRLAGGDLSTHPSDSEREIGEL
jgi:amino acid adenylation domain-containing protein